MAAYLYGELEHWIICKKQQISDSSKWENENSRSDLDWKLSMGAVGITNKLFLGTTNLH